MATVGRGHRQSRGPERRAQARLTCSAPASTYSPMRSITSSEPVSTPGRTTSARPTELLAQALLGPRQADVDRGADLGRVASDVVAVPVQHGALAGERLGATNGTFQPSAHWAAMRSVRFSPPPPTQIGSVGLHRLGLAASVLQLVKYLPVKSTLSSRSRPRTHWIASSSMSMRTPPRGTGCRRRRTRSGSNRRRGRGRPGRPRAGRWWRWRWPAPPGGDSRPSRRASRTAPASCRRPARRGWPPPRGTRGCR